MASALKSLWGKVGGVSSAQQYENGFAKAPASDQLFPKTNPAVDGEECLRDCESCTIKYPRKWSVDEDEELYGHVKGWSTHMIVATGKTDWVRDVADEKGSIMEAVEKCGVKPSNGKMMLSASDMPVPNEHHHDAGDTAEAATTILLLPSFTLFDNVTPSLVPALIQNYVDISPTNTTPLIHSDPPQRPPASSAHLGKSHKTLHKRYRASSNALPDPSTLIPRDCPHDYLILLCSHKTRDVRCGQSAPLLRREFERHLSPLGLYRDLHDERPGGAAVYFINHVGGHKFAANVIIYRRVGSAGVVAPPVAEQQEAMHNGGEQQKEGNGSVAHEAVEEESNANGGEDKAAAAPRRPPIREAAQCMWLARVRPEDCENIVKYTILQGKLVKPERQLRAGFDRGRQLVSW